VARLFADQAQDHESQVALIEDPLAAPAVPTAEAPAMKAELARTERLAAAVVMMVMMETQFQSFLTVSRYIGLLDISKMRQVQEGMWRI
jgi:hypothetical protein